VDSGVADAGAVESGDAGSIVLFGGIDLYAGAGPTPLEDTWTWNGTAWARQNVEGPSARGGALAASVDGLVVLFGGDDSGDEGSSSLSDTWFWNGSRWAQQDVSGPTSTSTLGAMARRGGTVTLFGGEGDISNGDTAIAATWTFDGTAWAQQAVSGPSARLGAIAAANALCSNIVLFGGLTGSNSNDDLGDTWTWDGASWTEQQVPAPPARVWSAAAALNGTVVLFGGTDATGTLGDTWTWDGAHWTQQDVNGPGPRTQHAMATLNGRVILFGGLSSDRELADTWAWDGSTWAQLDVVGPSARVQATMAGP
jgi:hypothetical protein